MAYTTLNKMVQFLSIILKYKRTVTRKEQFVFMATVALVKLSAYTSSDKVVRIVCHQYCYNSIVLSFDTYCTLYQ